MSTFNDGSKFNAAPFSKFESGFPAPASTRIAIGDLAYWAGTCKPLSSYVGSGNAALDQAAIAKVFLGAFTQARIAAQTTAGGYPMDPTNLVKVASGVPYLADCASATFEVGDLVGVVSAGAGAAGDVSDRMVVGVSDPDLAIGYVTQRHATAVTRVGIMLWGWAAEKSNANLRTVGGQQAVRAGALADANATLTVASATVQKTASGAGGLTADRTITLPDVAAATGKVFYFWNRDTAQNLVIANAGATTIITVGAGKVGIVVSDGTDWFGVLSA